MKRIQSTVAALTFGLGALILAPSLATQAQSVLPPAGVRAPVASTISGSGSGQSVTAADSQAAANLAAERVRIVRVARGPVAFGPITIQRTLVPGVWPLYRSYYRTTMTQQWWYTGR